VTRRTVVAVGLMLALGACGDDDGGGSSPTTEGRTSDLSTTTAEIGPTTLPGGGNSEICELITDVNGPEYAAAVERARGVTPPAELSTVWNDWLDGTIPFNAGDTSNAALMDRYSVATGTVGVYFVQKCPLSPGS
jgi:hypothetical protein